MISARSVPVCWTGWRGYDTNHLPVACISASCLSSYACPSCRYSPCRSVSGWLVVPALAAARRHSQPSCSGGTSGFPCVQCGRQFRWKSNLSRHLRLECGVERKFQCHHCQYRFVHKHHLESHVNKRHGECALPSLDSDVAQLAEMLGE